MQHICTLSAHVHIPIYPTGKLFFFFFFHSSTSSHLSTLTPVVHFFLFYFLHNYHHVIDRVYNICVFCDYFLGVQVASAKKAKEGSHYG